jgi:hypothetical protein
MAPTLMDSWAIALVETGPDPDDVGQLWSRHRIRLATLVRRERTLEAIWNDAAAFHDIVSSDRYFKLVNATCWASEAIDEHLRRMLAALREQP